MGTDEAAPFGLTVSADNLEGAREFYTDMYPDYASMTEGVFGTIKYFSLIGKDGEVLVNVLQKQADNPIHGAIPMLKVDSVAEWIAKIEGTGGTVVIHKWSALAPKPTLRDDRPARQSDDVQGTERPQSVILSISRAGPRAISSARRRNSRRSTPSLISKARFKFGALKPIRRRSSRQIVELISGKNQGSVKVFGRSRRYAPAVESGRGSNPGRDRDGCRYRL
jgi:hypothetical protein